MDGTEIFEESAELTIGPGTVRLMSRHLLPAIVDNALYVRPQISSYGFCVSRKKAASA